MGENHFNISFKYASEVSEKYLRFLFFTVFSKQTMLHSGNWGVDFITKLKVTGGFAPQHN